MTYPLVDRLPKSPVSFKLNEVERQLLDSIAAAIGGGRPDALRYALAAARKELGLYAKTAEAYVAGLRTTIGDDAALVIELDDSWSPLVSVDGVRRDDIFVPCSAVNLGAEGDFFKLYLGDPASDVRIFVGLMPARSGVQLVIAADELRADMAPRAIAYFERG